MTRSATVLCLGVWLLGCEGVSSLTSSKSATSSAAVLGASHWVVFEGACDASGAVPIDRRHFAVADDEDSVLRIYDAWVGGPPIQRVDVADAIDLETKGKGGKKKKKKKKKRNQSAESDIEAATRLGDTAFFLTSHARTKTGKRDPNRFRFFATTVPGASPDHEPPHLVGEASRRLLDDMLMNEQLAAFGLREAATLPAKAEGSLNIEGMTATFDDQLVIGFRSPQPAGKALVVLLENPFEVIDGKRGTFGQPRLLPLDGLGIRALSSWRGSYLVVAGATAGDRPSQLFAWDGKDVLHRVDDVALHDMNPEGFFTPEDHDEILLLSDDGARDVDGEACKRLKDPAKKRFRGLRIPLPRLESWLPARPTPAPQPSLPLAGQTDKDAAP